MNKLLRLHTLMSIANLSKKLTGFYIPNKVQKDREYRERKAKRDMPLTLEEKATLETLIGKQKKAYVKELKAKYEV